MTGVNMRFEFYNENPAGRNVGDRQKAGRTGQCDGCADAQAVREEESHGSVHWKNAG